MHVALPLGSEDGTLRSILYSTPSELRRSHIVTSRSSANRSQFVTGSQRHRNPIHSLSERPFLRSRTPKFVLLADKRYGMQAEPSTDLPMKFPIWLMAK